MGLSPSLWTPNLGGDTLDRPYLNQVNSTTDEQTRPEIRADARSLFPFFDGTANNRLLDPAPGFDDPTPEQFLNWHSADQLEYLRARPLSAWANTAPYDANPEFASVYDFHAVRIPDGDPLGTGPGIYAVLSSDGNSVIIINQLRPDNIATLGGFDRTNNAYQSEDQRRVRLMPAFAELVARPFSLVPNAVDPVTITRAEVDNNASRATMKAAVAAAIARIEDPATGYVAVDEAQFLRSPALQLSHYHQLFVEQLNILDTRLDRMEIFHPDSIVQSIRAVEERFQRVLAYKSTTTERDAPSYDRVIPSATTLANYNVNSTDRLKAVNDAANVLIGAEIRLFQLARDSELIVTTQRYPRDSDDVPPRRGRYLDAPNMTFLLQSFANYTNEAEAEAEAEDLKQHNRLLEDYSRFQTLLNSTLQAYDPVALAASEEDSDDVDPEELSIKGVRYDRSGATPVDPYNHITDFVDLPGNSPPVLEEEMQVVIAMFDETLATNGGTTFHPVEKLKDIERPMGDIVEVNGFLKRYTKSTWDTLAVNVAEATKLIGQDTQIRMNEINQKNKEKNRHYELASNSLNRLSSILRAITEPT